MKSALMLMFTMLFAASADAVTTRVLVSYEFGNQITRSTLMVLSDGTVMKSETLMGQRTYLEDAKLSASEVAKLISDIDVASPLELVRNDQVLAAEGGSFGEAKIYSSDGYVADLYTMVAGAPMMKTLVCIPGAGADGLRDLINTSVRDQMPLQDAPCK